MTVAVVDTGVEAGRVPALKGRVTAKGAAGKDCVGHGTFIAGIIAASEQQDTAFAGVAPDARILAYRGTDENGLATPDRVAGAIRDAADDGADVIAVSAALSYGVKALTAAVEHAEDKDALVVAPALPDQTDKTGREVPAGVSWPASVPQVLSVVAGGSPVPVIAKPELSAPGVAVSVGPRGPDHFIGAGSSLASAYVAGAAALVRARNPELSAADTARRLLTFTYDANPPALDIQAALTGVESPDGPAPAASPEPPVRMEQLGSDAPRSRAVVIATAFGGLIVLMVAAGVVIPRGRKRAWRAAGDAEGDR